jgi:hypothetical protein
MRHGDRGWTTAVVTENGIPGDSLPDVTGFDDVRTMIGLRTARYSLMVNRRGRDELYDLASDPLEDRNVFRDADYRAVREELLRQWTALRNCAGRSCRATLPADLRAAPGAEARLTRSYWSAVDATYGWR